MPFSVKFAAGLIESLWQGEGGIVAQILVKKLERIGEDLIMDFIGGPMGTAQRVSKAVRTGGQSEFDRTRDEFLQGLKPKPLPYSGLINKAASFFKAAGKGKRRRPGGWQASSWAGSREDWLANHWQHDWRSQPRDAHGRWIPGRLDYVAAQLQYRGKSRAGRKTLRRRKLRKMRKIATRREVRSILKEMKKRKSGNAT